MGDRGSGSASLCLSLETTGGVLMPLELSTSFVPRTRRGRWRQMPHRGGSRERHTMGPSMPAPVGAFSPLVFSPVELSCHPCPSPLACSPCLRASSIFPVLITSHNNVTLMSPRCTPTPDLNAAQGRALWPWSPLGLCTAGACCRAVAGLSPSPSVHLHAPSVRFCGAETRATSGPASAQHRPPGTAGWSPWGRASLRARGWAGLSIATVGCEGAASPPLEFRRLVAEHPSLLASA